MSAVEEAPRVEAMAGKDTRGAQALVGGVHPAPALTDGVLEQIRAAGLVRPRGPYPGQQWVPRTEAEQHLLREASRLERVRQLLLGEVGRLRHQRGVRAARREHIAAAARTADRLADCPLSSALLDILVAAAVGELPEDTSRRLFLTYDTVKSHRKRAVSRLGARSITHAVALAVAAGWITPEQITPGQPAEGVSP